MERTLMQTVRDTHRLWTDYMKSVAVSVGIPDSYRMVLPFLLRHPGASQKDIAEFRGITTASVSQVIKEMELTGYIRKEIDAKDQRYVNLYLTDKGKAAAEEIHARLKYADGRITELLTPETERQMLEMLHDLSEIIEKELPKC